MNQSLKICLVFFSTIVFVLCAFQVFAKTIKIGVLAPISHDVGEGEVNAAMMAMDEINSQGGINGVQLEIVTGDTELNPEKSINALKKMIMIDNVDAVIGCFSSGVVLSLMDYISRFKVPFIATASSSNAITEKVEQEYEKYKYVFRLMFNETATAEGMVDFTVNYLKPKLDIDKIAIMAEDAKWTKLMGQMFYDGVKDAGIEVSDYIRFPFKETDFAPILSRVKEADVDFLVEISAIADGATYINQWHDMQGPPIGGCNTSAGTDDFWDKTNGKCLSEILFMYGAYPIELTPKTKPFWDNYSERFKIVPRYSSGFAYDAVTMLAEAIKQAKGVDADKIVSELETMKFTGTSGLIEFDPRSHNVLYGEGRPTLLWLQWQGPANRVPIYPTEFSQGELILPEWIEE
ncbi:MAG: ABC transporter substrate-binding protein [Desulfovermiculus sp.]|nr:ABC transporter substrate-binding protein [Desulfovermiculus sp.]